MLSLAAIIDHHRVCRRGHKTEVGHRLAAMGTTGSPDDRQRFGCYHQHVNEGQRGRHQHLEHLEPLDVDSPLRMGEAVVTDFLKAAGQDVLEKPPNELVGRNGHGAPTAAAALAKGERDAPQAIEAGFALDQPAVADRHAVHVGCQIAEGPLPVSNSLAVNHPGFVADRLARLFGPSTGSQ